MGPLLVAAVALGVALLSLGFVLVQPRVAWRDAAEHSRWFWLAWVLGSLAIGGVVFVTGLGWAQVTWFALWCAFAAFQPAMITDVRDVHRHSARGVRARLASRRAEHQAVMTKQRADEWASDELRPIRWRADDVS